MSQPFATVDDIQTLYRPLSAAEQSRAEALLPLVSDEIRVLGNNAGRDIDQEIVQDSTFASVVKIVTVDVTWLGFLFSHSLCASSHRGAETNRGDPFCSRHAYQPSAPKSCGASTAEKNIHSEIVTKRRVQRAGTPVQRIL